jgi:NAD(P)-dependent dehydrogenase (short-subunit alcohol dehydrogenase family)
VSDTPLREKTIVVVGGTAGLGLAGASACVRSGARVVLVGRSPQRCREAVEHFGSDARALAGDAADPATAERAVHLAAREFGRLDGLYHVAGGSGRRRGDGALHEISNDGWRYTLDLNLSSLFYSNRAAVRQFLEQGSGGSVLNMTSVLAFHPSPQHFATHTYAATKAAVIGLTKSAAAYYAHHDIRFNAIGPALVDTPLAERACGDADIMRYVRSKQPLDGGRAGASQDLDAAVVFFLSDHSRYVTGQTLYVDGGWTVTEGQL